MKIANVPVFKGYIHTDNKSGPAKTSVKQDAVFLDCLSKALKSPRMQRDHGVIEDVNTVQFGKNIVVTTQEAGIFSLSPFKKVTVQLLDNEGKEQLKWEIPKAFRLGVAFKNLRESMNAPEPAHFKFDFNSPDLPGYKSPASLFYEQIESMFTGKPTSRELGLK